LNTFNKVYGLFQVFDKLDGIKLSDKVNFLMISKLFNKMLFYFSMNTLIKSCWTIL